MKLLKLQMFMLLFSSAFCRAQNNNVQDANATTPAVISNQDSSHSTVKNLFKWDYSLLSRGIFLLNYERRLPENLSIEFGLGLTYCDYIFYTYYVNERVSKSATIPAASSLWVDPFANSTNKIGFAIDLSLRTYLKKTCFEGLYFSPYVSYRQYYYSLTAVNRYAYSNSGSLLYDDLYYSFFDIGEKLGYQAHFTRRSSIYYDFYIGVAYRRALLNTLLEDDETITIENIDDATGKIYYTTQETITNSEFVQTMNLFQVILGAKIGIK